MDQPIPHEDLISEFCGLTGATPSQAEQFLEANRWDLSSAATEFFTAQEEMAHEPEEEPSVPENYTGPRTLDGRPAPTSAIPTVASSSRSDRQPRGGVATLGSMNQAAGGHAGHGHPHDDDDDEDDDDFQDDEEPRDLFAGGEKSGLAVQDPRRNDPRNVVNDIIKKAHESSKKKKESGAPAAAAPSRFRGTGMTLGGDDTPSQSIPDPSASSPQASRDVVTRTLHLWQDGFSIEDGPLHRFDDPQNAATLQLIRSGRAPMDLMNVRPNQAVEVSLNKHEEAYKPPPKIYKPFSGGGQRLGSPVPGGSTTSAAESTRQQHPAPAAAAAASSTPEVSIDSTLPTIALRIQLANGTRLPARFNTTHTIGDVYDFIERAYPGSDSRSWVLATTFPNKDHTDKDAQLGDVPEFKKGGTAVQKWT